MERFLSLDGFKSILNGLLALDPAQKGDAAQDKATAFQLSLI